MPTHLLTPDPTTGRVEALELAAAITAGLAVARVQETGSPAPTPVPDALAAKAARGHTAVADNAYAALVTDVHVGFTALTAPRTITLPDVDLFPFGQDLVVADESGQCSEARSITVVPGAGTADTIPATSGNSIVLTSPWQSVRLRRGAANVWLIV